MLPRKHPAKYSDALMPVLAEMLAGHQLALDPFGGTGKVHALRDFVPGLFTVSTEIEPEWAGHDPRNLVADALSLPFPDRAFDAVCTSPTYGNHMADKSKGTDHDQQHKSLTNKYFALLGRPLSPNNSGQLHWNQGYQEFHQLAWKEITRVLCFGGTLVLNVKNHIRKGEEQLVTEWHMRLLAGMGYEIIEHKTIATPHMGFGRNAEKRVPYESVIKMMLCEQPPCKHPPASMYAWWAMTAETGEKDTLCIACCKCGQVLYVGPNTKKKHPRLVYGKTR